MSDFKERLKQEFSELYEKKKKLDSFLINNTINNIDENQKHLLVIQAHAMQTYLQCLDSRLQLLK